MKKVLLTGGAGFIGHHTIEHILKNTDWNIVLMDRLTYSGNLNFLMDLDIWDKEKHRVKFIGHDFRFPVSDLTKQLIGDLDYIIHMGAESHVDNSIKNPEVFFESNVIGTVNMLQYARTLHKLEKFLYISTDEVYGPAHYENIAPRTIEAAEHPTATLHMHREGEPHRPSNPYSASKSGAEAACYAFWNTYKLPVIITNTMNNFGERQNCEKFVTKTMKAILEGKEVILHCKKDDKGEIVYISSRCWLHARNHADGILFVLEHGIAGESYNISGEWADVEMMADKIGSILELPVNKRFEDFHSFRAGHDMHYGLDNSKLKSMGWIPPFTLDESLKSTVLWTKKNPKFIG